MAIEVVIFKPLIDLNKQIFQNKQQESNNKNTKFFNKENNLYLIKTFIVITFSEVYGKLCKFILKERFAFRLKKLVENNYPQFDLNVVFKTPKTIGSLFSFKDNIKNIEVM